MEVHDGEAVARGQNLSISRKHAREVGEFINGEPVTMARQKLEEVMEKQRPVPVTRYNSEQAHRKGDMDAGRYPVNAAEELLALVNSAASNAVYEGLDEDSLYVSGVMVTPGNRVLTPGRHRGRKPKAAHVTVKVGEQE